MTRFRMPAPTPWLILALVTCVGCAQTRRYTVQVLNKTATPLTIGLSKEGTPFEPHLAAPEEAALSTPSSDEGLWPSTVVEPGRVGFTRVEGKFKGNARLVLRLYQGKLTLSDVLAVPRGSSTRADVPLDAEPAINKFVVTREAGLLHAESVDRLPRSETSPQSRPSP